VDNVRVSSACSPPQLGGATIILPGHARVSLGTGLALHRFDRDLAPPALDASMPDFHPHPRHAVPRGLGSDTDNRALQFIMAPLWNAGHDLRSRAHLLHRFWLKWL
jgi:hypothetical protein